MAKQKQIGIEWKRRRRYIVVVDKEGAYVEQ